MHPRGRRRGAVGRTRAQPRGPRRTGGSSRTSTATNCTRSRAVATARRRWRRTTRPSGSRRGSAASATTRSGNSTCKLLADLVRAESRRRQAPEGPGRSCRRTSSRPPKTATGTPWRGRWTPSRPSCQARPTARLRVLAAEMLQKLGASPAAEHALAALPGATPAGAGLLVAVLAAIGAPLMPAIARRWAAERQPRRPRAPRAGRRPPPERPGRDGLGACSRRTPRRRNVRVAAIRLLELTPGTEHLPALEAALSDARRIGARRGVQGAVRVVRSGPRVRDPGPRHRQGRTPATQLTLLDRLTGHGGGRILPVLQRLVPQIDPQTAPVPRVPGAHRRPRARRRRGRRAAAGDRRRRARAGARRCGRGASDRRRRSALRAIRQRAAPRPPRAGAARRGCAGGRTMTDRDQRTAALRRHRAALSGALRAASLYSIAHPSVGEHVRALLDAVRAAPQGRAVRAHRLHRRRGDCRRHAAARGDGVPDRTHPLHAGARHQPGPARPRRDAGRTHRVRPRGLAALRPSALRRRRRPRAAEADIDFLRLPHVRAGRIPVDTTAGKLGLERRHDEAGLQRVDRGRPHGLGEHADRGHAGRAGRPRGRRAPRGRRRHVAARR